MAKASNLIRPSRSFQQLLIGLSISLMARVYGLPFIGNRPNSTSQIEGLSRITTLNNNKHVSRSSHANHLLVQLCGALSETASFWKPSSPTKWFSVYKPVYTHFDTAIVTQSLLHYSGSPFENKLQPNGLTSKVSDEFLLAFGREPQNPRKRWLSGLTIGLVTGLVPRL